MKYEDFLGQKIKTLPDQGFDVPIINDKLFPFQQTLTRWAIRKGRCALFCDTGLGKTAMQLVWAEEICKKTGKNVLILAPLAVGYQTEQEAIKFGIPAVKYCRDEREVEAGITVTNYERLHLFDPSSFIGIVLDESSILKSYDGKTRTSLIQAFANTPYRLCCTATPAPNDITEIANHAEFLGIMTRAEMLAAYFVHDEEGWRLKGHGQDVFYRWLAGWGMMLKHPSNLGFPDDGYQLPELKVNPVWVESDALALAQANGQLFPMGLRGIRGRINARQQTLPHKVEQAADILNQSNEQWVVWCGLNDEGRQLRRVVPDVVLVEGADSADKKTAAVMGFIQGEYQILIGKVKICGFGLNLQRCHNMMFLGLSDSWESYYQAIRRCWRFGQTEPVNVQIVLSEMERPVFENICLKEERNLKLSTNLVANVAEYERAELGIGELSSESYRTDRVTGDGYLLMLGDCVERLAEVKSESVDFSVFSPPFLSLYTYSNSERDMGNNWDEEQFFTHFSFFLKELYRVTRTGRNVAIHVAQVATQLARDGYIGLKDFRGKVIDACIKAGFDYHGDITVDKNPQVQAIRTHAKALLFAQLKKDASWLRPGLADYILVFRKPGENTTPIHPDISNDDWIRWAHPCWYDIRETDTLNIQIARTDRDERHICPLQLGLIERCIRLWSNPGEVILDPFTGIGSTGYCALKLNRNFVEIELKQSYFNVAHKNLEEAITRASQGRLL